LSPLIHWLAIVSSFGGSLHIVESPAAYENWAKVSDLGVLNREAELAALVGEPEEVWEVLTRGLEAGAAAGVAVEVV